MLERSLRGKSFPVNLVWVIQQWLGEVPQIQLQRASSKAHSAPHIIVSTHSHEFNTENIQSHNAHRQTCLAPQLKCCHWSQHQCGQRVQLYCLPVHSIHRVVLYQLENVARLSTQQNQWHNPLQEVTASMRYFQQPSRPTCGGLAQMLEGRMKPGRMHANVFR